MGKIKGIFCYRISSEAGMAYDHETGENAECYIKFALTDNNDNPVNLLCGTYAKIHIDHIVILAAMDGMKKEWFEPITIEEYMENVEE